MMTPQENSSYEIERLTTLKPYVIGLSVMEKTCHYGIVDSRGNILRSSELDMEDYPDPTTFVFDVCARLAPMIDECGGFEKVKSMGISASSGNNLKGSIENPSNIKWVGNIPLAKMFEGGLGLPVTLRNDATAATMGEHTFGVAHGFRNFICVNINGGLGAGLFINNQLVMGSNGSVGEIGHCTMFPNGRPCGCGKLGCLERYVSRRGVINNALDLLMKEPDTASVLRSIPADKVTIEDVIDAASKNDEVALRSLHYTGRLLGKALASVVSLVNPEAIIIAGWVGTLCGPYIQRAVIEALNEDVFTQMRWQTQVLLSTLDPSEAPLLYASAEAWSSRS